MAESPGQRTAREHGAVRLGHTVPDHATVRVHVDLCAFPRLAGFVIAVVEARVHRLLEGSAVTGPVPRFTECGKTKRRRLCFGTPERVETLNNPKQNPLVSEEAIPWSVNKP